MAKELHEQLNSALLARISEEMKEEASWPGKRKRLKSPSSLDLRKFLDEEIESNELLLNKLDSLPIDHREALKKEIQTRIDCFKQLDSIVQEWNPLNPKHAKQ